MKSEQSVEMMKIRDDFTNSLLIYLPQNVVHLWGIRPPECLDFQRIAAEAKGDTKAKYLGLIDNILALGCNRESEEI
jgi:hypothetical protein